MRTIMGKVLQAITGSTKRIVGIMAHDFQRVFTNPVAAIIAVGVMVLPSLYAWFNIQASWDPYGSTDNISVAVSNVDEGTVVQGMELNVGKSIVESLAENEQIGWKFVNKEKALAGVRSGKYYAAVVIPEDFSKNMTSVLTPDIERPKIEYYVNEKKNAIAPKITDKGVGVIQQMVNKTFISESVTVIGDVVLGMSEKDKALNRKLVQDISLDKEKEQVEKQSYFTASTDGQYIYYNGLTDNHNIYEMDTSNDHAKVIYEGNCWMPVKDGNNLYFMDCENDYRIAKVDLTNGEKTLVTDCRVDCYNVTGDKIFFQKNDKTNPAICCINTDGSNYQELKEGNYTAINVTSTYVYFKDFTTKTPYYTSVAAPGNVQIFNP